jgi:hypothetical protein
VGLPSIELTPLARAVNLLRISQCYRLVETLAEGLVDQRPRGRMVSTDASMDLQEELLALIGRDALHQHSHHRWAALEKLTVDGEVRLGASGNPSCLGLVSWEDLIKEVGQQGGPPVGVSCRCSGR